MKKSNFLLKGIIVERFLVINERKRKEITNMMPPSVTMGKMAEYFQNFSDTTRIRILACLCMSEMCVSDISNLLSINQTTVSHQLRLLKTQNLVSFKRDGKILIYSLANSGVNDIMMYAVNSF